MSRRLLIATMLALMLVAALVGGASALGPDGDDDTISICVAGSVETGNPLTVAPAKRALYWLNEDLASCQTGYTQVDWLNS